MPDNAVLSARVELVNQVRNLANNVVYPRFREAFTPFMGAKIYKADGSLVAKAKATANDLMGKIETRGISIYRYPSPYSLVYVIKGSTQVGHIAYYHEESVYLAEIEKGVMTKWYDPPAFPCDFSVDSVLAAREALKAAKEALSKAESDLFPFGEYDR